MSMMSHVFDEDADKNGDDENGKGVDEGMVRKKLCSRCVMMAKSPPITRERSNAPLSRMRSAPRSRMRWPLRATLGPHNVLTFRGGPRVSQDKDGHG